MGRPLHVAKTLTALSEITADEDEDEGIFNGSQIVRIVTFIVRKGIIDPRAEVRNEMLNAGVTIVGFYGGFEFDGTESSVTMTLFELFEKTLNSEMKDATVSQRDWSREGTVVFYGSLAQHLAKDDPVMPDVVRTLLKTSWHAQRGCADGCH